MLKKKVDIAILKKYSVNKTKTSNEINLGRNGDMYFGICIMLCYSLERKEASEDWDCRVTRCWQQVAGLQSLSLYCMQFSLIFVHEFLWPTDKWLWTRGKLCCVHFPSSALHCALRILVWFFFSFTYCIIIWYNGYYFHKWMALFSGVLLTVNAFFVLPAVLTDTFLGITFSSSGWPSVFLPVCWVCYRVTCWYNRCDLHVFVDSL